MLIHIPASNVYVTVKGKTNVYVDCERCQVEYVYRLRRRAHCRLAGLFGLTSKTYGQAYREAQRSLRQMLTCEIDAVPCPKCGWYQEAMVAKAGQIRSSQIRRRGFWIAMIVGGLFFPIWLMTGDALENNRPWIDWRLLLALTITMVLPGLVMASFSNFWTKDHDPNLEDVELRLQRGQERALTARQFDGIR